MNFYEEVGNFMWDSPKSGPGRFLSNCLWPAAVAYGTAAWLRERIYRLGLLDATVASAPVISVGNITLGGSGKTPLVMELAREFHARGARPVILTRGYGGSDRAKAHIVSQGDDAFAVGDEALLLARSLPSVPVVRGAARHDAAIYAEKFYNPGLYILDDGFGHLKLKRDFDIVVVDAHRGFGNSRVFPAGPLREPLTALRRANVIIIRHDEDDPDTGAIRELTLRKYAAEVPVIKMRPVIEGLVREPGGAAQPVQLIENKRVFAFSGIANPDSFDRILRRAGFMPVEHLRYPDHHNYRPGEIAEISRAERLDVGAVITTEKDLVRFGPKGCIGKLPLFAIRIRMEVERLEWLIQQIQSKISDRPGI